MRLGSPVFLLAWALLPLLAVLIGLALARQRALLARLGQVATVRRLARDSSLQRRTLKALLLLVALFCAILALARPQWGKVVEPMTRQGVDVILAVDVSESMNAQDVTPDRFTRARAVARALTSRLDGNRVGLVAFAGTAFVQCPLTLDQSAVHLFLDILEVGDVPDPGSNLEEAIRVAMAAFPEENSGQRVMVLITDGEDLDGKAAAAAAAAAEAGIVIYSVGVGTPGGGPIPRVATSIRSAEYKKDAAGKIITTRLAPAHLEKLARAGGGRYLLAGAALGAVETLAGEIDRMEKAELSSRMVTHHKERYQLPLLAALLFLFAESAISPSRRQRSRA
jgi:Ca-activated chloride channel family protein